MKSEEKTKIIAALDKMECFILMTEDSLHYTGTLVELAALIASAMDVDNAMRKAYNLAIKTKNDEKLRSN